MNFEIRNINEIISFQIKYCKALYSMITFYNEKSNDAKKSITFVNFFNRMKKDINPFAAADMTFWVFIFSECLKETSQFEVVYLMIWIRSFVCSVFNHLTILIGYYAYTYINNTRKKQSVLLTQSFYVIFLLLEILLKLYFKNGATLQYRHNYFFIFIIQL